MHIWKLYDYQRHGRPCRFDVALTLFRSLTKRDFHTTSRSERAQIRSSCRRRVQKGVLKTTLVKWEFQAAPNTAQRNDFQSWNCIQPNINQTSLKWYQTSIFKFQINIHFRLFRFYNILLFVRGSSRKRTYLAKTTTIEWWIWLVTYLDNKIYIIIYHKLLLI